MESLSFLNIRPTDIRRPFFCPLFPSTPIIPIIPIIPINSHLENYYLFTPISIYSSTNNFFTTFSENVRNLFLIFVTLQQ